METKNTQNRVRRNSMSIFFTPEEKAKAKAFAKNERLALGTLMRKMILDAADKWENK